jgi:hypothetical protein
MTLSKLAAAAALGFTVLNGPANAAVVIDIFQDGGDVVATGAGTLDLTGLTFLESAPVGGMGVVVPVDGVAIVGPDVIADVYDGANGPASFGPGFATFGSDYTGLAFGVAGSLFGLPVVVVPHDYVSGAPLLGSSTFAGETIASLGLTPGTYVYTWHGAPGIADSLTLNIGPVPEPATCAMIAMGFAGLGLASYRRSRTNAAFGA